MMESLLGDQVTTGRHSPLRVLSGGELATCCIIPGPSVKQMLLSGCERACAWRWAEWTPPTVIPEMIILCCGCPRIKQLRPSSSDFSFPGYSPSKQANRFKTILLFFYNSALTRSSGLLRALPQELVHPCNDPVLAGGNRWTPDLVPQQSAPSAWLLCCDVSPFKYSFQTDDFEIFIFFCFYDSYLRRENVEC